jgi:hypothetical protein
LALLHGIRAARRWLSSATTPANRDKKNNLSLQKGERG